MVSSVILKKKDAKAKSAQSHHFNMQTLVEMVQLIEFLKAYCKEAIKIHNTCVSGAPVSEYQSTLASSKKHAKNKLKLAKKALELDNTPANQQEVSNWQVEFNLLSEQIQSDIAKAKKQYLLIRQCNWLFVTLFHELKDGSDLYLDSESEELVANDAIFGHAIGTKGEAILIIKIAEFQIACPQGFTNLSLDSDGFHEIIEHCPIESGIFYEGKKDIMDFEPEILKLIQEARQKYITYDVK